MNRQQIVANIVSVRPVTVDCTMIEIHAKVIAGPTNLTDRRVTVVITANERDSVIRILRELLDERQKTLDNRKEQGVISKV